MDRTRNAGNGITTEGRQAMTINAIYGYSFITNNIQIKTKIPIQADHQYIDFDGRTVFNERSRWICGIWFYLDGRVCLTNALNQKPLTPAKREWI